MRAAKVGIAGIGGAVNAVIAQTVIRLVDAFRLRIAGVRSAGNVVVAVHRVVADAGSGIASVYRAGVVVLDAHGYVGNACDRIAGIRRAGVRIVNAYETGHTPRVGIAGVLRAGVSVVASDGRPPADPIQTNVFGGTGVAIEARVGVVAGVDAARGRVASIVRAGVAVVIAGDRVVGAP
jgi:hypothetical protein